MPPIDPAKAENILTDTAVAQEVYGQVKQQVYSGIAQLQEEQRVDPKHSLPSRCDSSKTSICPQGKVIFWGGGFIT